MRVHCLLIAALLVGCASPTYFFDPDEEAARILAAFDKRWWGPQLRAMREPSLYQISQRESLAQQYRLLVLPSFEPAYAVRVVRKSSGRGTAVFKKLDGQGGYDPGSLSVNKSMSLSEATLWRFLRTFDAIGVADYPSGFGPPSACTDGTSYLLEGIREGS